MYGISKRLFKIFVGFIATIILLFVAMYIATIGKYPVKKTVTDDPTLDKIEIDGKQFYGKSFGADSLPLLVAVYGGPGFDHTYLLPLQELSDEYHVVLYDQTGCGLSPRADQETLGIDSSIYDLGLIIDHFGGNNEQVFLVGHSWGSLLCARYTTIFPEKVAGMVLFDTEFLSDETLHAYFKSTNYMRPQFNRKTLWFLMKHWFRSLHIRKPDDHASHDYFMGLFFTNFGLKGHPLNDYICGTNQLPITYDRYGAVASSALMRSVLTNDGKLSVDFSSKNDSLFNHTLLLSGTCNELTGPKHQESIQKVLISAQTDSIGNAGFNPFYYEADESLAKIRGFFNTLK